MSYQGKLFTNVPKHAFAGNLVFDTDIKCSLHTSVPDQDTAEAWADVSGTEVAAGGGYTAGGKAITAPAVTVDGATNKVSFDCADISWADSTITARCAVFRDASTGKLLGFVDFGANKSSENAEFTIKIAAAGLFYFTVA